MLLNTTYLAILIGTFVLLSPGFLLTLPALTQTNINNLGVGYNNEDTNPDGAILCSSTTTAQAECKKPTEVWVSGYTSVVAALVHALVFALVLYALPTIIRGRGFSLPQIAVLSGLFLALSPGVLLTLPPLSRTDCGKGEKNIADVSGVAVGGVTPYKFCAGTESGFDSTVVFDTTKPNCKKCVSPWMSNQTNPLPVIVHSLVFAAGAYAITQYV